MCEDLSNDIKIVELIDDIDTNTKHLKFSVTDDTLEEILFNIAKRAIPLINTHFDVNIQKVEKIEVEYFTAGHTLSSPKCDNSMFFNNQWVRDQPYDFTMCLFLNSEYDKTEDLDVSFECYGGSLQFPQHHQKIHPSAGCAVVYPSDPHFINLTGSVALGSLMKVNFYFSCDKMYNYNPKGV